MVEIYMVLANNIAAIELYNKVHNKEINNYYYLDWSEATIEEIKEVAQWAFEDLNTLHSF